MSKLFFSSDYHFYHRNIIKYENRPFDSLSKMNTTLIKRHNERVSKNDVVYFLGDLGFFASKNRAFRGEGEPFDPKEIINTMNGHFIFIKGNHDKSSNKLNIKTKEIILRHGGLNIQLLHDPTYAKIEADLILCGHVHSKWTFKELRYLGKQKLIINVGVDNWDFYPVSWNEVYKKYKKWEYLRKHNNYTELGEFFTSQNK